MNAQIRAALGRMGVTNAAAQWITDVEGYDSVENLTKIQTDEDVKVLCAAVRKPGGFIQNPHAHIAGQAPQIPNPGIPVSAKAEKQLKTMAFYLQYKARTSRNVTPADITEANVNAYAHYKEWEENQEASEMPELNDKDWSKTFDAIDTWISDHLGITKIPLAYITRDNVEVPAGPDPATNYSTKQEEMIMRAPHTTTPGGNVTTEAYKVDNVAVWELLFKLTREHSCYSYVKPHLRAKNGRAAYLALKEHYLGTGHADDMATKAENALKNLRYHGETRRWNFEKYSKKHKDQHTILDELQEKGLHNGINGASKVRYLMAGIKTNTLDTINGQILADNTLKTDFDRSVTLYKNFISQKRLEHDSQREATVASVGSGREVNSHKGNHKWNHKDGKDSNIKPDMSVQLRYYKKKEYEELSPEQRLGLKRKREARDAKKRDNEGTITVASLTTAFKNALKVSKHVTFKDDEAEEEEEEGEEEDTESAPKRRKITEKKSNNNRSLSRGKK